MFLLPHINSKSVSKNCLSSELQVISEFLGYLGGFAGYLSIRPGPQLAAVRVAAGAIRRAPCEMNSPSGFMWSRGVSVVRLLLHCSANTKTITLAVVFGIGEEGLDFILPGGMFTIEL